MKRLNIDTNLFSEYATKHTLKELADYFNLSYQQAKDFCHHHNIKIGIKEHKEHNCSYEPLYAVWKGMMSRCYKTTAKDYPRYGGRQIRVCPEWHNVKTFVVWSKNNGWQEGLQLDRINNDDDYCPENCRFVTNKANMNNRSNTIKFNGESLVDILADNNKNPYNIERHTAWYRLKVLGWSLEKTLKTPVNGNKI